VRKRGAGRRNGLTDRTKKVMKEKRKNDAQL
jgi:hypothetical protein